MSDGGAGDFLARLTAKLAAAGIARHFTGSLAAQDAAVAAADALAELLRALGATDVDSAWMD